MTDNWYSIGLEAEGPPLSDVQIDDLIEAGNHLEWFHGPAFSFGGDPSTVGVQVSIQAEDPLAAIKRAIEGFARVTAKADVDVDGLAWGEVQTEERFERVLSEPAPGLAGVTEVAAMLGVSKQRVDQLRAREDFPKPIAELAAGPVWREDMLQRFIAEWPRRQGRPPKPDVVAIGKGAGKTSAFEAKSAGGRIRTAAGRRSGNDRTVRSSKKKAASTTVVSSSTKRRG